MRQIVFSQRLGGRLTAVVPGRPWAIDGAHGRITSNFVVSDDGEITDHQLGVVFVARPKEEP